MKVIDKVFHFSISIIIFILLLFEPSNYLSQFNYNDDFDGDSIINMFDIDDDNDGIIDIDECTNLIIDNNNWKVNGSTSIDSINKEIIITPKLQNKYGSIWYKSQVDISTNIEIEGDLFFGDSPSGADGMTMTFHTNVLTYLGNDGEALAYESAFLPYFFLGWNESFTIAFDTYHNGSELYPEDNVRFSYNYDLENNLIGTPYVFPNNIEDNKYHHILFSYNPTNDSLKLFFDSILILKAEYDIITNFFGGTGNVTFGFTGSTGSDCNKQSMKNIIINNNNLCDYDKDGISNIFDLDSDNDGCSDAYEGGAINISDPNFQFTSSVGTNGLADIKETYIDSNIINYNLTYNLIAIDSNLVKCGIHIYNNDTILEDSSTIYCYENIDSIINLNENLITIINDTCIKYNPISNFYGYDTIDLLIYRDGIVIDSLTKYLVILPTIDTIFDSTLEDVSLNNCKLGNIYYGNSDSSIINNQADSGILSLSNDCFNYIPAPNFNGHDTGLVINKINIFRDSIIIIVKVMPVQDISRDTINDTLCFGQIYNDLIFGVITETGIYIDTNIINFDLFINQLNLYIFPKSDTIIYENSCDSFLWSQKNQTYYTTGIYKDTIQNSVACDSIITLDLTINSESYSTQTEIACDSFLWPQKNQKYYTTGIYKDTIQNSVACDSIITLELTIKKATYSVQTEIACDSFLWSQKNQTYYSTGIYNDTIQNSVACDSIITLDLTINNESYSTQTEIACDSFLWSQKNQTYYSTGIYKDTIQNSVACDSIITLELTIKKATYSVQTEIACDSFFWSQNNKMYYTTGIYKDTIQNSVACDSIITLDLTINSESYSTQTEIACDSFFWSPKNQTYYTTGIYKDTIQNSVACDSIITLDLTINSESYSTQTEIACDSFLWSQKNQTYYTTGIYKDTIQNSVACDSIITLELTIKKATYSVQTEIACDSFFWSQKNQTYYTTGIYKDTIQNSVACDSIITLELTIKKATYSVQTEIACDSFFWSQNNKMYYTTGIYKDTIQNSVACDSIITLELTIYNSQINEIFETLCNNEQLIFNNVVIYQSGTYRDTLQSKISGCDSIIKLNVTIFPSYFKELDTIICKGQILNIGNISTNIEGEYYDTLKSVNQCDSIIKLNVYREKLTPKSIVNDYDCMRFKGSILLTDINIQNFEINWFKENELISTNTLLLDNIVEEGKYQYRYKSSKGCEYSENIFIKKLNEPISNFDYKIKDGNDFMVDYHNYSTNGIIYKWHFGNDSILEENNINVHSINYRNMGESITTLITNNLYCSDTISKLIVFDNKIENCIYIPNIITPNGDNINDIFKIEVCNKDEITYFQIQIFNRWGEKVYQNNSKENFEYPDFIPDRTNANTYLVKIKYIIREIEYIINGHFIILE